MAFKFNRKSNLQDNIERMATETLTDVILEYYDVDSLQDLSEEQVAEISTTHSEEDDSYISMAYNNILESIWIKAE